MTSLLELLRAGSADEDVLAWDAAAEATLRQSEVEVLKLHSVHFDQRDDPAVALAVLVAGRDATEVSDLVRWCRDPGRRDLVDAVVARRTQQWRDRLFTAATTDELCHAWWLIRSLMRVGIHSEPGDLYLDKFMGGAPRGYSAEAGKRIVEFLYADPGTLDDELFRLMSTEGVTRRLSGWGDGSPWLDAIEQLAGGDLRDRILDTAWDGLIVDWRPVDQRPLLELLKRLEPTADERIARLPGLLRMTSSDNAPIVVWALKQLTDLLVSGLLDADALLAVRAPLTMRDKGTATAHLALLEKALRAKVGDPVAIARTAALALDHPHDVIRARASKLVAKHAPDQVAAETPVVPDVAEPLTRPPAGAFPLLTDTSDFIELMIASLAQDLTGIEIEQLLEATPRFAFELDARARKSIAQASDRQARGSRISSFATWKLAEAVAEAEAGGPSKKVEPRVYSRDFESFDVLDHQTALAQRFHHLAWAMKQANLYLGLATPSTTDGAITLADLQSRFIAADGLGVLRVEIAAAALRLSPSEYVAAEAEGALGDSEASRAFLRDLRRIREHRPEWKLSRLNPPPHMYAERHGFLTVQDESPRPAGEPDVLAALLDRRDVAGTKRRAAEAHVTWGSPIRSHAGLLSLALPHHREHYASHVLGVIRAGMVSDEVDPRTPYILGLATGSGPTGLATAVALACATSLIHAENRAAIVDALVERATYGELDGQAFGRALRELIETDKAIPRRIAAATTEAGRALGPLSWPIVDALVELLPLMRHLNDGHAFVATLGDLATELGRTVELPEELAELREKRASTALTRAVQRVPVA